MADVTTTLASSGELTTWDIPPGAQTGLIPRGEIVFAGGDTIPALGAGDESRWLLTMTFPRGFHWRLVEASVQAVSDSAGDLQDPEPGMRCLVTSDAPDFVTWNFALHNDVFYVTGPATGESMQIAFSSQTTNDRMAYYLPHGPMDSFIDSASGTATLAVSWMNINPVTAAIDLGFRFRALCYDQDQVRKHPVHTPTPIIGA